MEFKYQPEKTVEAAGLFLKLHGKPMEYMKLIKLLYMADRRALDFMYETITGDKYYSMDHGPILSRVYDLIVHGPEIAPDDLWFKYISSPSDYQISLLSDPGTDELCEEEEDIIKQIYAILGTINVWKISKLTHFFPEWTYPNGSSVRIRIEDILRAMNKSEEDICYIRNNIFKEGTIDILLEEEENA